MSVGNVTKIVVVFIVVIGLLVGFLPKRGNPTAAPVVEASEIPYSIQGTYSIGFTTLSIDSNSPLSLAVWYPAEQVNEYETKVSYPFEVKFTQPLGTLSVASFEGKAVLNAPPDFSMSPYPLVILSPGFGIRPTAYAWLAEHLASYGFVVLSPNHNEQLDPEHHLWRAVIARPKDILAVFSYVDESIQAGTALSKLYDPTTVAVIGHSFGGYTALAAAGARIDTRSFRAYCSDALENETDGAWLCGKLLHHVSDMANLAGLDSVPNDLWPAWTDHRVDAIVPMAGNAFFFGSEGLSEISVPVMAIGGTADTDSPFMWGTHPAYEYVSSTTRIEIALNDAEHMIFTCPCEKIPWYMKIFSGEFCFDQSWDRTYAHRLIKHFTTAFLLGELKDNAAAAAILTRDDISLQGLEFQIEK
ncbi:MAG: hypothetical protein GWN30_32235 [Gammaproteobacteria bacterium]|nr:hypothetical protein [Gammaproteobacteria bacterium]